jgi:hypothetical protein
LVIGADHWTRLSENGKKYDSFNASRDVVVVEFRDVRFLLL